MPASTSSADKATYPVVDVNPSDPAVAPDRVCGVVDSQSAAAPLVDALAGAGFGPGEIRLYTGAEGAIRLDPTSGSHRWWARPLRLLRSLTPEGEHLHHYAEDLAAGRVLVSVEAGEPRRVEAAVRALLRSGAHAVHRYGLYTVQDFSVGRAHPHAA